MNLSGLSAPLKRLLRTISALPVFWFAGLTFWVGVLSWFVAVANATLDGERPLQEYQGQFGEIALSYLFASGLTTLILYMARRRVAIQYLFLASSAVWTSYVLYVMRDGLSCGYWHQGEINCGESDNPVIPLFAGTNALFLILLGAVRLRGGSLWKTMVAGFLVAIKDLLLINGFMSGG